MTALRVERCLPEGYLDRALRADARTGLSASPKTLPPKWLYDENGSELFEKITQLDEYYPTRAERSILASVAGEIAATTGASALVELARAPPTRPGCCWTPCVRPGRCAASSRWTSARPR